MSQGGNEGTCFDQSEHGDGSNYVHLPLHVQLEAEKNSVIIAKFPQGDQADSSDGGSECTNPHLRNLLNRHFPTDLEFQECFDADGEMSLSDSRRHVLLRRKRIRRRRNNDIDSTPSVENDSISEGFRIGDSPQDEHQLISQLSGLTTDGETKLASGDSSVRRPLSRSNQWDSSPSAISDEAQNKSISFDAFFNPIDDEEEGNGDGSSLGIRKYLFSDDDEMIVLSDEIVPRTPEAHGCNGRVVEENSDLELTQLSRQMQLELRLQEMTELAREAERAAEEGKEKFVGNATKFELGLGLDVGDTNISSDDEIPNQTVDRLSWKLFGNIDCNRLDYDAVTPLRGSKSPSAISQTVSQTDIKKLKRPSVISLKARQSSAPANTGAKTGIKRRSLHSMPSILSSGTFLSVAPATEAAEEKIPVLALRQIDEVIPKFKEMHLFMKRNMKRCGVKDDILNFQSNKDGEDDGLTADEKDSCRGTIFSSRNRSLAPSVAVPFFTRVPSFNLIMKSMSGMSGTGPGKLVQMCKSDDEISYRPDDTIGDNDADISLAPDDLTLDCVSFVSCGDTSRGKAVIETPEKKTILSLSDDDEISLESDNQNNVYACTLATELHDPSRTRPSFSPLPKAPFDDDEEDLEIIAPALFRTPRSSRWSTLSNFWENISPAKRQISLPSPLNTWAFANDGLSSKVNTMPRHGGSTAFAAMRNESTFHSKRDETKYEDEPWELQKDDASNGIIISSQSFSQTVPRSHSPFEWYNGNAGNFNKSTTIKTEDVNAEDKKISDEVHQAFSRKEFCKGSFMTSITHISGDDSQSTYSKLSLNSANCSSQLMVRPLENNPSNRSSQSNTLLNPASTNTLTSKDQDLLDKPPLHPIPASRLSNMYLSHLSHPFNGTQMIEEAQILPTIKASISCPDVSDGSCALSMASESETENDQESLSESIEFSCKTLSYLSHPFNGTQMIEEAQILPTIKASISCPDVSDASCALSMASESETENDQEYLSKSIQLSCKTPDKPQAADVSMCQSWQHDIVDVKERCCANVRDLGTKKEPTPLSFEFIEEEKITISAEEDENNRSISFKNLIEKVPSVIGRFRPFRKGKQNKPAFKDDTEFVKNYFFTGVKVKPSKSPMENNTRAQANPAGDLCTDFNCDSVFESALICLSTEPSRVYVNHSVGAYTHDQAFSYPHSRNQKYGNLNTPGKSEKVRVGDRIFRAPYLKVLKWKAIEADLNQSFDSGNILEL